MTVFAVSQIGARRHYAVPRILEKAGLLSAFFTDFWLPASCNSALKTLPSSIGRGALRRAEGRYHPQLPSHKVRSFPLFGLRYALARHTGHAASGPRANFWGVRAFAETVSKANWGSATATYTFSGEGLEVMRLARGRGLVTVMDQKDAARDLLWQLMREERCLWPDWSDERVVADEEAIVQQIAEREKAEWLHAKVILCGSDFVRDSLIEQGVPGRKCILMPYGVDSTFEVLNRPAHGGRLRVLSVGDLGLRKGTPYLCEAAKYLHKDAEIRLVGAINIPEFALRELACYADVMGRQPRSEVVRHLEWADVFLLPSLSEGSAGAVYEALAAGLPVITTPNTGTIVRDGVDGYVVPIRDSAAIVAAVQALAGDPFLRAKMSENARQRYLDEGNVGSWTERLVGTLRLAVGGEGGEIEPSLTKPEIT